ncbi:hypothetical protein [Tautonia marina]|uniref:hypothetical protein n=1 Tax=Tautonia marina TaxID=2653855 RepID=UPI0012604554|nr:hypothetical protein [Tautonia marina]
MPSLRQIEANRRNAQKSTGPKTEAGKAKVARNALKHGLAGHGVVLTDEMTAAIEERKRHWITQYRPDSPAQLWRFERIVIESVRADGCVHRAVALRDELAQRAAESWDDDRALDVEHLGLSLADHPEVIQPTLLQSRHGVLWLLDRWDDLADRLDRTSGDLSDADLSHLLDLLGVPASDRNDARSRLVGTGSDERQAVASLLADTRTDLQHRLDSYLIDRDERARIDAQAGLNDDSVAVRLLDRYENQVLRRLRQAEADLRRLQGPHPADPVPASPSPQAGPNSPADLPCPPEAPTSCRPPQPELSPQAPAPVTGPSARQQPIPPPKRPDRSRPDALRPSSPSGSAAADAQADRSTHPSLPRPANRRERRAFKAWKRRHPG